MPRVSVVITCFNYARYLPEAVASVQAQTLRDAEIIIIDDGSTDDSLAVARTLAAGDPRIVVVAQENSGQPAIPRNRAIEQARAPYVLCLDADDRLGPLVLEGCAAVLDADPRLGMAYGQQQDFGDSTKLHHLNRWNAPQLASHNIQPCTTLFRRDAWRAAGGYRTNVRGYEDWDLWLGITEAGYGGREVPGVVWHYRTHDAGVYKQAVGGDQALKAQVVVNHARLYGDGRLAWARAVLAGDDAALALGRDRAIVPDVADPPRPLRLSSDPAAHADWHVATEGLEGPWPGRDLAGALEVVDRLGYTAVAAGGAVVARKWEIDPLARAGAPLVFPGPFFLPGTPPQARAAELAGAFEALVIGHRLQAPGPIDAARAAAHVGVPAGELQAVVDLTTTLLGDGAEPVPVEAAEPVRRMAQVLGAQRLLAGDAAGAERVAVLQERAQRAALAGARRVTVLAFGDELAADPGLLRAFGRHFGAEDDITLVIATGDPEAVVATVAAAGLEHDASPDMLAVAHVPAGVDAVLSGHAHGAVRRVDAASVATLRELLVAA